MQRDISTIWQLQQGGSIPKYLDNSASLIIPMETHSPCNASGVKTASIA